MFLVHVFLLTTLFTPFVTAREYIFQGKSDHISHYNLNQYLLQYDLERLQEGDVYTIPEHTYYIRGGVVLSDKKNITLYLNGQLIFPDVLVQWPKTSSGSYIPCLSIQNSSYIHITSRSKGILNGDGSSWWSFHMFFKYRPTLFHTENSHHLRIEHLYLLHSPRWSLYLKNTHHVLVQNVHILVKRTPLNYHTFIDYIAYDTRGIVIQGSYIQVKDSTIWNQGESVYIFGNSSHVTMEGLSLSGKGITLSSVEDQPIQHVHVRNVYFYKSRYGIVLLGNTRGYIQHILFENITLERSTSWNIWIQSHPYCKNLLIFCPLSPIYVFYNITLRNIHLKTSQWNIGFIVGDYLSSIRLDNLTLSDSPTSSAHSFFPSLSMYTNDYMEVAFLHILWIYVLIVLFQSSYEKLIRTLFLLCTTGFVSYYYIFGYRHTFIHCLGVHSIHC